LPAGKPLGWGGSLKKYFLHHQPLFEENHIIEGFNTATSKSILINKPV